MTSDRVSHTLGVMGVLVACSLACSKRAEPPPLPDVDVSIERVGMYVDAIEAPPAVPGGEIFMPQREVFSMIRDEDAAKLLAELDARSPFFAWDGGQRLVSITRRVESFTAEELGAEADESRDSYTVHFHFGPQVGQFFPIVVDRLDNGRLLPAKDAEVLDVRLPGGLPTIDFRYVGEGATEPTDVTLTVPWENARRWELDHPDIIWVAGPPEGEAKEPFDPFSGFRRDEHGNIIDPDGNIVSSAEESSQP